MVSVEEVRNRIQRFRLEPIEIFTEKWEIADHEAMSEWLQNQPHWISMDNHRWRHADPSSGYRELTYVGSPNAPATLTQYKQGGYRYLVYLGILFLPITLLSPSLIWGLTMLVSILGVIPSVSSPLTDTPAYRVHRDTNIIPTVLLLAGVLSIVRVFAANMPSQYRIATIAITMVFASIWVYSINGFPHQSTNAYAEILRIPLGLMVSATCSLVLIFIGTGLSSWVVHYTTTGLSFVTKNPRAVGSRLGVS